MGATLTETSVASDTPWLDQNGQTPLVQIKGVTKKYGDMTAVDNVDLDIYQGELFCLLGGSGCGKSTLLRMLAGFESLNAGTITIDGIDMADVPAYERPTNMMFQSYALFPHMTGRENIIFPLKERGASEAEISKQLDFVSEVLHVSHILHKNPAQMSGGERQRIALGRAFAGESRAMLLDEPIAALDARLREEMRVELKRLQRENNQTFVYVSHDEEEVMAVSDRVAVVTGGKIAQIGTPDDVYSRPNSTAVAEVIGSPPMNFFPGDISTDGLFFESDKLKDRLPIAGTTKHGGKATLGIRPEDIWLGSNDSEFGLDLLISSVEPLGGYTILNARLSEQIVKIRAPGQVDVAEGSTQRVSFDQRRIHLFDEDGKRI